MIVITLGLAGCSSGTSESPLPSTDPATLSAASPATPTTAPSSTPPAQPETDDAAAAAFRTWVEQFNAGQWDEHWATLVSAQQQLITEEQYAACRDRSKSPEFTWVKLASTKSGVDTNIPGTSISQPSTEVVARVKVSGATLPVTAHMFYENGAWRWSMTEENLKGCGVSAANPPHSAAGLTVLEFGFGQRDENVWVTAVVTDEGQNTGKYITANFNLLDASGDVLESETQVEQLTWKGQKLVLGTQVSLDSAKTKVASIDVDTSVGNASEDTSDRPQFTTGPAKVSKDDYGTYVASFEVMNPTAKQITDLRIGVVCYNSAGTIIGGDSVFPDLVPANGKIKAETLSMIVSGKPASCKAFPGGFSF